MRSCRVTPKAWMSAFAKSASLCKHDGMLAAIHKILIGEAFCLAVMDFSEVVAQRRCVRNYDSSKEITDDQLKELFEIAKRSPLATISNRGSLW